MNQIDNIKKSDLDLGGLIIPEFNSERLRQNRLRREAEKAEYKKKYGDDWFKKWWTDKNPEPDYDRLMKSINECIYYGTVLTIHGIDDQVHRDQQKVYDRMHEIYGDQYDELETHVYGDSRAVELLLQDAIKTGRWKELPDELQSEYHRRVRA